MLRESVLARHPAIFRWYSVIYLFGIPGLIVAAIWGFFTIAWWAVGFREKARLLVYQCGKQSTVTIDPIVVVRGDSITGGDLKGLAH